MCGFSSHPPSPAILKTIFGFGFSPLVYVFGISMAATPPFHLAPSTSVSFLFIWLPSVAFRNSHFRRFAGRHSHIYSLDCLSGYLSYYDGRCFALVAHCVAAFPTVCVCSAASSQLSDCGQYLSYPSGYWLLSHWPLPTGCQGVKRKG